MMCRLRQAKEEADMWQRSSIPGSIVLCASLAITPLLGCVTKGKYDSAVTTWERARYLERV